MDAYIGYAVHGCGALDPDNVKPYYDWADEPDGCEQYHAQMELDAETGDIDALARVAGVLV